MSNLKNRVNRLEERVPAQHDRRIIEWSFVTPNPDGPNKEWLGQIWVEGSATYNRKDDETEAELRARAGVEQWAP